MDKEMYYFYNKVRKENVVIYAENKKEAYLELKALFPSLKYWQVKKY